MRTRFKNSIILSFALSITCAAASSMDCTLSRENSQKTEAWMASCGLQRGGPQWTGFIQGPLLGSHLTFVNAQKKITIEGATLAPLSNLSEIPSCNSISFNQNETCKLIAKKVSLPLPFELIAYAQDPVAFTIGSRWDTQAKTIARGSELIIAACGTGPDKKPDESAPLLYFRKKMDCKWTEAPTHPLAINCKTPSTGKVTWVSAGNISCELRQAVQKKSDLVTDAIPVVCITPNLKPGMAHSIDPISCLEDDRVGFTTQVELRSKIKVPHPAKTAPTTKSAAGTNGT